MPKPSASKCGGTVDGALKYWLALYRTPGIGSRRFAALLAHFGSPQAVFQAGPEQLRALRIGAESIAAIQTPDWHAVGQDRDWLSLPGHHLLTIQDPDYPPLLREIPDPPPLLFIDGHPEALQSVQIGIVGSRNPTAVGRETAHAFARKLAESGLTITSGLARGIDAAAHRGVLAGAGETVAVTGCGPDRIYPAAHRELAREIAQSGAVISEFPIGTPPSASNFPRRNRIVSGLSLGVLVVEAAERSGALITARLAGEQGREVFAIPGSIHSPLARGCNRLIRDGAKLVQTETDILEEIAAQARGLLREATAPETRAENSDEEPPDPEYQSLLEALGYEPTPIDILVERTGLTADMLSSMLLRLELQGAVACAAGGVYSRCTQRK